MQASPGRIFTSPIPFALGVLVAAQSQAAVLYVDVNSAAPTPPYAGWATAAVTIQDAIDAASASDLILVTNGVYAAGGKVMAGDLTNRVALDKALTVQSVNGYSATVIKGAWDPSTTNGPLAVRCAWLTNGAVLRGFTLQQGATRSRGILFGAPAESGGGVWCASTNGVVSNCLLTDNSAIYGGGIAFGTLKSSAVIGNFAQYGGGAFYGTLANCTVVNNFASPGPRRGAGTYDGETRNSIVVDNYDASTSMLDNHAAFPGNTVKYTFSCTAPTNSGIGNIDADPLFLDSFHIMTISPCRAAGSSLYASGTDWDGEPWGAAPSMGCDEVWESALTGPLSVSLQTWTTNRLVNHYAWFTGTIDGRASRLEWSFGDGTVVTNVGYIAPHRWVAAGDYVVTLTAFNTDHPGGVSTNLLMHVVAIDPPQLQSAAMTASGFQFAFQGQGDWYNLVLYTIEANTNLTTTNWWTAGTFFSLTNDLIQFIDANATNGACFYRVLAR
jgi:hypothetical protein